MDAIEALLTRNSAPKLSLPAPNAAELETIVKAGLRANDHRRLRPWKFLLSEGDARNKLGELFIRAKLSEDAGFSAEEQQKLAAKPLRAPLIIAVIAAVRDDPKVPDIEQLLSAGAAAQLMMVATHALGYAGIWRTGGMAYSPVVNHGLGLQEKDQIVGFLYIGTAEATKPLQELDPGQFLQHWPA